MTTNNGMLFCYFHVLALLSLQCFDAVGWASGRASGLLKTEWWDVGVVVWDEVQTCI